MTTPGENDPTTPRGAYAVAVVLAVGMCVALNVLTAGILIDALYGVRPGISENATQILTGWGGGIVGVIGAVVGYSAGHRDGWKASRRDRTAPRYPNE